MPEQVDPHEPPLLPSETLANFTNRKAELAVVNRLVRTPVGQPIPLLYFWDVGGTGKSWLLKWLQRHVTQLGLPTAYLNLEDLRQNPQIAVLALANLREQLAAFDMPKFDLCLRWYFIKAGFANEKDVPTLPGVTQANLLVKLAEGVAGIPLLGSAVGWLARKMERSVIEKVYIDLTGQEFYHTFREKTVDELRNALVLWFAADLANAPCPEAVPEDWRVESARRYAPMAVVFLDTLEELRKGAINTQGLAPDERWITQIHTPNIPVLFVVAGRDENQWAKSEARYQRTSVLESHRIGGLARADALEFLDLAKVAGDELREAILLASRDLDAGADENGTFKSHPFSLGVSADSVHEARKWGIPIDPVAIREDGGNKQKIAERFLKSLGSDEARDWIRKLAVTPRFDERAAKAAYSETLSAEADAAWRRLLTFSFVRRARGDGTLTFHANMKDALTQTDGQIRSAHQWWAKHWQTRSDHETDDFAALAWYHRYVLDPNKGFKQWNELAKKLRGANMHMAEHFSILEWWELCDLFEAKTEISAKALNELAIEYSNASLGDRGENLVKAIACCESVLAVYTQARFPQSWAATQNNLGIIYRNLPTGDQGENLRKAIVCCESALAVYTQSQFPQEWAVTQNNLGSAYRNLPTGDKGENLGKAIACYESALTVHTQARFPQDWAMTQNNLGIVYHVLPTGDRVENLRKAIAFYESALAVYTHVRFPQEWATTINNLGSAYLELPTENLGENLEKAIKCFESALVVRTRPRFPHQWAMIQINLGAAYRMLPTGGRGENLGKAVSYNESSLEVYTQARFPQKWATTHGNLAHVYADWATIESRYENRERAIEHITNAIEGFRQCGDQHNRTNFEQILTEWVAKWNVG